MFLFSVVSLPLLNEFYYLPFLFRYSAVLELLVYHWDLYFPSLGAQRLLLLVHSISRYLLDCSVIIIYNNLLKSFRLNDGCIDKLFMEGCLTICEKGSNGTR